MSEALEIIGIACLCALCFFVWPPLAFLPAAIGFIIAGVALDGVPVKFRRKGGTQ